MKVARAIPRSSPCRSRAGATSSRRWACAADRLHIVPVGVDRRRFRPLPHDRAGARSAHDHRERRRPDEGARPAARGAREDPHRARRRRTSSSSASRRARARSPASSTGSGLTDAVRVRLRRHHRAHRRALRRGRGGGRAVALRGLLAARGRGDGVRGAARRHHRRRAARGGRHRRRDRACSCPPATRRARHRHRCACSTTPSCGPASARPDARGCSTDFTWRQTAVGTVEHYRRAARRARVGTRPDADGRLRPARPGEGDRLLDMGCGGGRHAFTAMRRGATVVALDYDAGSSKRSASTACMPCRPSP